ncbi:hypothetical protein LZ31DRAFT_444231, partial [Colletotrichum somersetense]
WGTQAQALEAIVIQRTPVVWVAGTGRGKSLAFQLLAAIACGGTTVVVVPLLALQNNLKAQCKGMRLDTTVWTGPDSPVSRLILVTLERSVTPAFWE